MNMSIISSGVIEYVNGKHFFPEWKKVLAIYIDAMFLNIEVSISISHLLLLVLQKLPHVRISETQ